MQRIVRCAALAASVLLAGGGAIAEDRAGTATGTGNDCTHHMTGTVKQLDKTTGTVSIGVPGGDDIELHLSPNELAKFRQGDEVVLSMGIRESRSGGGATGTSR